MPMSHTYWPGLRPRAKNTAGASTLWQTNRVQAHKIEVQSQAFGQDLLTPCAVVWLEVNQSSKIWYPWQLYKEEGREYTP